MSEISLEQEKLIKHIKLKVDKDANIKDFISLFRGWSVIKEELKGTTGLYYYDTNTIYIHNKLNLLEQYDVFFHEFGHLIHEVCNKTDFYNHFSRMNLKFSELLESERQATLIGLELWKFRFPGLYPISKLSYYNKDDILFLQNYYKDFFEDDTLFISKIHKRRNE